jgi:hypothetical protein
MFRPYLASLRQLFISWNCYTALVRKLKYSSDIPISSFTLKHICFRTSLIFWRPVFCVVLCRPMNIGMVLLLLFLCVPTVCMFSRSCCSRVYITLLLFGNSWVVAQLSASQESLSYTEILTICLHHLRAYVTPSADIIKKKKPSLYRGSHIF